MDDSQQPDVIRMPSRVDPDTGIDHEQVARDRDELAHMGVNVPAGATDREVVLLADLQGLFEPDPQFYGETVDPGTGAVSSNNPNWEADWEHYTKVVFDPVSKAIDLIIELIRERELRGG